MSLLALFRAGLPDVSAQSDLVTIKKSIEKNKERFKDMEPGPPLGELTQESIKKFLLFASKPTRGGLGFSWMEMSALCWGLFTPVPQLDKKTMLEHGRDFSCFMKCVHESKSSGALTTYPWHGLFSAYLAYSPWKHPEGKENWEQLRLFLKDTWGELWKSTLIPPRWLEALQQNIFILSGDISKKLAKELLEDNNRRIELSAALKLPDTSWFWPRLLLAQVDLLAIKDDQHFKSEFESILQEIEKRKVNEALAKLLERYAKCETTEEHEDLKMTAIRSWGSPMVPERVTKYWNVWVSEAVLNMVKRWQVTRFVGEFFKDSRRFEFWMQFLNQISHIHLVLGVDGRQSFRGLLAGQMEHHSDLSGAVPGNNAFIMRIGDIYLVEFGGVAGGKCWAYQESTIKPMLKWHNISADDLRNPTKSLFARWGTHDGLAHQGGWEDRFIDSFSKLDLTPDILSLSETIDRYELVTSDGPSGTQWIRTKHNNRFLANDGILGKILTKYGFEYKKGGYYRAPDWSPDVVVCPGCSIHLRINSKKPGLASCPDCKVTFPVSM